MIYRGISVTAPREGNPVHIKRLKQEIPWSKIKNCCPKIYKEASCLVSLYEMGLGVLRCGVVAYYQTIFSADEAGLDPDRLLSCEEWHCTTFDSLCRLSRSNAGFTSDHQRLKAAAKAFHAMEGDPALGYVKGAAHFERALANVSVYFFQVCEQKAEYLCKALGKELAKQKKQGILLPPQHINNTKNRSKLSF